MQYYTIFFRMQRYYYRNALIFDKKLLHTSDHFFRVYHCAFAATAYRLHKHHDPNPTKNDEDITDYHSYPQSFLAKVVIEPKEKIRSAVACPVISSVHFHRRMAPMSGKAPKAMMVKPPLVGVMLQKKSYSFSILCTLQYILISLFGTFFLSFPNLNQLF